MASLAGIDPFTTPTNTPPPGQQPNFTDPPSSQDRLVAVGVLCLTVAIIFISARTFVKMYIIKKAQIEDCGFPSLIVLAGPFTVTFTNLQIQTRSFLPGLHLQHS